MIDIIKWHNDNGGFCGRLAGHALRLLGEAIELCVSLGAKDDEILAVTYREIDKATERNEFHAAPHMGTISGEFADVSFLFKLLAHYSHVNIEAAEEIKFPVLLHRQWEADQDGVLWRPGKAPL